jgi:hypothetical protein
VLLVVDDLDRCMPLDGLQLAESLKLLLEDPIIWQRVQVLMAVDEEVLSYAIMEKFDKLIEARSVAPADNLPANHVLAGDSPDDEMPTVDNPANGVIREHIEKLFACTLRLGAISSAEISELVDVYTGEDPRKVSDKPVAHGGNGNAGSRLGMSLPTISLPGDNTKAATGPRSTTTGKAETEAAPIALYSPEEIAAIKQSLPSSLLDGWRRPSPRAVRLFLFKYQLCRSLIANSQIALRPSPEEVITALASACFKTTGNRADPPLRNSLAHIVSQVV